MAKRKNKPRVIPVQVAVKNRKTGEFMGFKIKNVPEPPPGWSIDPSTGKISFRGVKIPHVQRFALSPTVEDWAAREFGKPLNHSGPHTLTITVELTTADQIALAAYSKPPGKIPDLRAFVAGILRDHQAR